MFSSLKPRVAPARLNVARASPRVFTDSEWEAATKSASLMLASAEQAEAAGEAAVGEGQAADVGSGPAPEGRTFSDAQWEQAMKGAPMLLKTLQSIEEDAASSESASAEPTTASAASTGDRGSKVFTPDQWDAAIKVAVAAKAADEEKVCSSPPLCLSSLHWPTGSKSGGASDDGMAARLDGLYQR